MKRILFLFTLLTIGLHAYAQQTDASLTTQANVIRNETATGANTALRVGNMFNALINYKTNINFGVIATGTDTYAATIANPITTYTTGDHFIVKFTNANTGAATLNINLIGAKSIVKNGSTALSAGDIAANTYHVLVYDGTNLQMLDLGANPVLAGSGLTKTGSTIDLGGVLSSDVNLTVPSSGLYGFNLGASSERLNSSSQYYADLYLSTSGGFDLINETSGTLTIQNTGGSIATRATKSDAAISTLMATEFGTSGFTNRYRRLGTTSTTAGADGYIYSQVYEPGSLAGLKTSIANNLRIWGSFSNSGGTGASAGYGQKIYWALRNGNPTLTDVTAGGIAVSWTDPTHGSEDSKYTFSTVVAGSETSILDIDQYGVKYLADYSASQTDDYAISLKMLRPAATVLSGTELTFDRYQKNYTKTISADQTLSLAASGNVANSYITLTTTGDGTHVLSFPTGWIMSGDSFDPEAIQEISLKYTGTYVIGVIITVSDVSIPGLTAATIEHATDDVLDLYFDESVTITTAGWSVSASGGAVTVSGVSGSGTTTPSLTLSRSIIGTETVTVSYDPTTGSTVDYYNNEVATISGQSVNNYVIVTLMSDDFADGVISTSNWDETDPVDGVSITETGGRLQFSCNPASPVASSNTNVIESDNAFDWDSGTPRVVRATLYRNAQAVGHTRAIQIAKDANNGIKLLCSNDATVTITVTVGGVNTYAVDTGIAWDAIPWKIVYSSNFDIAFYSWNGSAWIQRGTTQNHDFGTTLFVRMGVSSVGSDTGTPTVEMDDFYLTNRNYETVTP
jgi:hypothetical protein